MRRRVACILATLALSLTSCESGADRGVTPPTVQPVPSPTPATSGCAHGIGTRLRDLEVRPVLGVVALPTSPDWAALTTARLWDPNRPRLFAKSALVVRAGASFRLEAAPGTPKSLGFSRAPVEANGDASASRSITVKSCPSTPKFHWLAYIGGYYIDRASCVSLMVETGSGTRRVNIGLGAPCPGQPDPPGTSQR
jgi:hypothetical protein